MDIRCKGCGKLIAKQTQGTHTSSTSVEEESVIEYKCIRCKKLTYINIEKAGD